MMAATNEETKGERRERKRRKKRYGHKVSGRSVQTLQRIIVERAEGERAREGGGKCFKRFQPYCVKSTISMSNFES